MSFVIATLLVIIFWFGFKVAIRIIGLINLYKSFADPLKKHFKANNPKYENNNINNNNTTQCVTCGVYIPISNAIYKNSKAYCSHEHLPK